MAMLSSGPRCVHLCAFLLLVAHLFQIVAAEAPLKDVTTTSTSKEKIVGWNDSPDTRGTLDIIENCLLTIIACTFSVLHLNLPDPRDSLAKKFLRKLKWTAVTVIFPEFILAHASSERQVAVDDMTALRIREASRDIGEKSDDTNFPAHWTVETEVCWRQRLLHPLQTWKVRSEGKTRDAEQGRKAGTVVTTTSLGAEADSSDKLDTDSCKSLRARKTWTISHSYYANMGGIRVKTGDGSPSRPSQTFILTGKHLTQIDFDPDYSPLQHLAIAEEEIQDKRDADAFAKMIAIIQIFWLIFSVVTRKVRHIPSTQLEIVTLAFSVLAICIYAAYWNKPQNIEYPSTVYLATFSDNPERDAHIRRLLQPVGSTSFFGKVLWHLDGVQVKSARADTRIPNDNYDFNLLPHCLLSLVVVTVFFGGLHCIAWDFAFPTTVEVQMWRSGCVVTTVVPALIFASQYIVTWTRKHRGKAGCVSDELELHPVHSFCITLGYAAYVLGRILIMTVALTSLRRMPFGVYVVTWAKYLPSVQ